MKDDNKLIGSAEAAKLLGITRSTLYQWTSERKIPFIKISRNLIKFDPEALRAWIEAKRVEAISRKVEKHPAGKPKSRQTPDIGNRKPVKEKPKSRSSDGKVSDTKKAITYRAQEYLKEKDKRLKRARMKAAEDAIGKPDEYE